MTVPDDPVPGDPASGDPASEDTVDTGWCVVVEVDPEHYAGNEAAAAPAELALPEGVPPREVHLRSEVVLIGRGGAAAIDLGQPPADPAVSHRHATLQRRDDSWVLVDEGSTNGTRLVAGGDPVAPGHEIPLDDGGSVLIGAWTRLTLRRVSG